MLFFKLTDFQFFFRTYPNTCLSDPLFSFKFINSSIFRLVRRTDTRGQVVFSKDNLTSPVSIKDLRAATPYTLFVSGNNGQVPFEFTEHFTTKQKR